MGKLKTAVSVILSIVMMISMGLPGKMATEVKAEDSAFTYYLDSNSRDNSNRIYKPNNETKTITNNTDKTWENLKASLTEDTNKDINLTPSNVISLKLSKSTVAPGESVDITYNFSRTDIPPHMSEGVKLQLTATSGLVKEINFQYSTTGYRMEFFADPTMYPEFWSGKNYDIDGGVTKLVGTFDVLKQRPSIQVTYKASTLVQPGKNVGTKKFTLPSNGDYYFYRKYNSKTKKYTYYYSVTAKYQKNGQKNTVTIHMKETPRVKMKNLMIKRKYVEVDALMENLAIEYTDGTIEGGAVSPLYLVVRNTRKPIGRVTTKVKYRKKKSIKISWGEMKSATGYAVYRSTKKNSGYKKIATTTSKKRSFVNTSLKRKKTYYYKVRAYRKINKKNYYSSYSEVLKVKTK
ncbi:MAG: fibronectin type III domain-containing protein [Anaerostipes sp.]|nr:fibronectin type III domain-containing protein [Anaerostipes sp.]